jgi:hypothetical protein
MSTLWDGRIACKIFGRKPRRWRPLRRSTYKWVKRIKIGLEEQEWEDMHYIRLAQVKV